MARLGRTPGEAAFFKLTGVKRAEVLYYWPRYSALAKEAGTAPNEFQSSMPDEEIFRDFARVCLHLGKIPTKHELHIAKGSLVQGLV